MRARLKKRLRIVALILALLTLLGLLLAGLTAVMLEQERSERRAFGEDLQLIHRMYGGTLTRQGVLVHAPADETGTTAASYRLVQTLARHVADNGTHQLLLLGMRDIKPAFSAKIDQGALDVVKLAETGQLEQLIDRERGQWRGIAVWMARKDGQWTPEICCAPVFTLAEGSKPLFEFPVLAPRQPSFVVDGQYFSLIDGVFQKVLTLTTRVDDLDACLAYRQAQQQALEAAMNELGAPSTALKDNTPLADQSSPQFACVRAQARVNVLTQRTEGFYDIEVHVDGEGPARVHTSERYLLQYSPKEKRYGYERIGGELRSDPMGDFVSKLQAAAY